MKPGMNVKALKNHNRVEVGTIGVTVDGPKGSISRPEEWVWVQFSKFYGPKLMKPSELEVIKNDMFYG